jgi:hypothetical protein
MDSLRASLERTVEHSRQIEPVDEALVESGYRIANQIDYAVENLSGQDLTKALYLMPHLVNILRELLATPAARKAAGEVKESAGGKLARLRSVENKRAG